MDPILAFNLTQTLLSGNPKSGLTIQDDFLRLGDAAQRCGLVSGASQVRDKQDDVPQILAAFKECNHGGRIVFPEGHTYWIAQKLNPVITDVTVDWKGTWLFSDDIEKWRNNTYWIEFQNHWTAFALSGQRIHINGHGTGGIDGSGNSWYNVEKTFTQPGRPMAFTPWNVTDLHVEHFSIIDSPLWALFIINGTNSKFDDIVVNSTAVNAPWGTNWVQNTDGFDTMDSRNISLTNFIYQGKCILRP
ncbi:unnamed protein product [Aspergillus oryzae]|nr:unnamed protein product [Aspergillus oryzae]